MSQIKRFAFVDWYGMPVGIKPTDNLQNAIADAIEFQHEVIDTQDNNCPVYSVWDGGNRDWKNRHSLEIVV